MTKRTLGEANAYLRDPARRRELVILSVSSSSAVEGIRVSPQEMRAWPASPVTPPRPGPRSAA